MNLFEINDAIERIMAESVDRETGEISEEAAATLDDLEIAKTDKLVNCMLYMKGELAEAAGVKSVIDQLTKRMRVHENRAKWIERWMEKNTDESVDIKDPRGRIYYKESPGKVELDPPDMQPAYFKTSIDPRFVSERTEVVLDKQAALAELRAMVKRKEEPKLKGLRLAKPKTFKVE